MKKKYMNPTTTTVHIQSAQVIAASPIRFNNDGGTGVLNDGTASGAALSREADLWEDEDF